MKTIYGLLIRKQREEKGMTLSELSDRCLIREKFLKEAEKGEPVLSRADLVIICNALDISSVALEEGRLVKKPGAAELEELIRKLEEKAGELQESIMEMKAAAAALTGAELEKSMEKSAASKDIENRPETRAEPGEPGKVPEPAAVRVSPEKKEPAGPVM